ncbi:MAG: hypothetical protein ACLQGP_30595 [Isosphaeraceae bacterium]
MSYALHITRSEHWSAGERKIARNEWERIATADPGLKPYPEAWGDAPYRLEIPDLDNAFSYEEDNGTIDVVGGYFGDVLRKVLEIAAKLGAVVQGDSGEFYRQADGGFETSFDKDFREILDRREFAS